jgi:hypothetical protein
MIKGHSVFLNNSYCLQIPVHAQLAIPLFQFGHQGNAASIEAFAKWAGVYASNIVNSTQRVMVAFQVLHDVAIHWLSEEEKEEAKEWVESVLCPEWQDGFFVVDGILVPLFEKPGHHSII